MTLVLAALLAWPWDTVVAALNNPAEPLESPGCQSVLLVRPRRESGKPQRARAQTQTTSFDFDDYIDGDGSTGNGWRLDRVDVGSLSFEDLNRRAAAPLTARIILLRACPDLSPKLCLRC
ncbi:MAG: hypothetical protein ABI353_03915 [Isosphaeraceae bacterium]